MPVWLQDIEQFPRFGWFRNQILRNSVRIAETKSKSRTVDRLENNGPRIIVYFRHVNDILLSKNDYKSSKTLIC